MQVFTVNKRYWTTDHDGWKNWIESIIVSYHATLEGADAMISSFPDKNEKIIDDDESLPVYFISSIVVEE